MDGSADHHRGRFDVPSTMIAVTHLTPLPDLQRRRESAQVDEGSEEWQRIQQIRAEMVEEYGARAAAGLDLEDEDEDEEEKAKGGCDEVTAEQVLTPKEMDDLTADTSMALLDEADDAAEKEKEDEKKKEEEEEEEAEANDLLSSPALAAKTESGESSSKQIKVEIDAEATTEAATAKDDDDDDDDEKDDDTEIRKEESDFLGVPGAGHRPIKKLDARRKKPSPPPKPHGSKKGKEKAPWQSPRVPDSGEVAAIDEDTNRQLWFQIMKDVNRTLQYKQVFRERSTKIMLGNILYVWARMHQEQYSYLQGMNELLAMICCALWYDLRDFAQVRQDDDDGDGDDELEPEEEFISKEYFENDCFTIYNALMALFSHFFGAAVAPTMSRGAKATKARAELKAKSGGGGDDGVYYDDADREVMSYAHLNCGLFDCGRRAPLFVKLHYLQHKLLKHWDFVLYSHLCKIGLEPQLYMMRWIRVLFSREFYVDQVILLWDELFVGASSMYELIDCCVMSMLYKVRADLLSKRDITAIAILQNYPKDEVDIKQLAKTARDIKAGLIKLQFDRALRSDCTEAEMIAQMSREAMKIFSNKTTRKVYDSYPLPKKSTRRWTVAELVQNDEQRPDVGVPGYLSLSKRDKLRIKRIILRHYGLQMKPSPDGVLRMGYLVKKGDGAAGLFSRDSLKLRWFVVRRRHLYYYKNQQSYKKDEEPMKAGVKLLGRAVRVVDHRCFCFEISGDVKHQRAYLLFAPSFRQFVLWLHALMYCADQRLDDLVD